MVSTSKAFDARGGDVKEISKLAKVGDIIQMEFTISGGHIPGSPRRFSGGARRLTCLNGASILDRIQSLAGRVTHRRKISTVDNDEIKTFVMQAMEQFNEYRLKIQSFMQQKMTTAAARAYMIELVQPSLLRQIVGGESMTEEKFQQMAGAEILNRMMERDGYISKLQYGVKPEGITESLTHKTKTLLDLIVSQPGHNFSEGTVADPYNAVTYYATHLNGKEPETGVLNDIEGSSIKMKQSALDLAVEYTQRLQTM